MKQWSSKSLANIIDKDENFNFRPSVFTPPGIHKIQIFEEVSSEIAFMPRALVSG